MDQKSPSWLEWRRRGIGSSDAPIILGVSPYSTPYKLWLEKTGQVIPDETSTFITERGNELEPIARAKYELETMVEMQPQLCQHKDYPWLRASMDGVNFEEGGGLEIKFIGENDFKLAEIGVIPAKYIPQIQHQFLVTGLQWIDFYGYNVPVGAENHQGRGVTVRCLPIPEYIQKLMNAESLFWDLVQSEVPPPFSTLDYKSIRAKGAKALAAQYIEETKRLGAACGNVIGELLGLCEGHERVRIYNLRIEMANGAHIIKIVDGGTDVAYV